MIRDFLREEGYSEGEVQECIDTFIVNAKFVGLLRNLAGAERLLQLDHVLDELPTASLPPDDPAQVARDLRQPRANGGRLGSDLFLRDSDRKRGLG